MGSLAQTRRITRGTSAANKAVVLDANSKVNALDVTTLSINGTAITSTAAEINAMAGTGLSATELGYLDGVTAGTVLAGKAVVTTTSKHIDALVITDGGLALGAGAGTAITATAAEINLIDGSLAGTAVASKALSLGATKNVDTIVVADGGLYLGAGAGTAVTSTAAELNILDGVTATAGELNMNDDSLAFADGLSRVRVATATWDFAEHAGAIGAVSLGVTIPDNAVILDGMVDVVTTCTTAAADAGTMAISVEGADDIVAAVAVSAATDWDLGLRPIKPLGTSTTAIKTTAARAITATIATQEFTAGKFVVFLRYVLSA